MDAAQLTKTVAAIVRSPAVGEYKVGVTRSPRRRRAAYFGVGFHHYVVLESGLTATKALQLEQDLHEQLRADRRSVTYQKFRHRRREGPYRRSLGGRPEGRVKEYCVYVAWIDG